MTFKRFQILCGLALALCTYEVAGVRLAEQKCQEYIKTIAALNPVPVDRTNDFAEQTNGVPAKEAEFPHVLRFGQWAYEDDDDPSWIIRCSGALISERYVLVPAHCMWATADEFVSLGRHDYRHDSSLPEVRIRRVNAEDLIFNPGYDEAARNSYNDIALLRLEQPVNFTSHIYPACLWTDETPLKLDKFTATSFTMGKFVNDTDDTYVAKLLAKVLPNAACAVEYANNTYYKNGITAEHVCVESAVQWNKTCEGDVGGLLQTLEPGSTSVYRLYAVEGNGFDCEKNSKFTYTKVQNYLDWIEKIVWGA